MEIAVYVFNVKEEVLSPFGYVKLQELPTLVQEFKENGMVWEGTKHLCTSTSFGYTESLGFYYVLRIGVKGQENSD